MIAIAQQLACWWLGHTFGDYCVKPAQCRRCGWWLR